MSSTSSISPMWPSGIRVLPVLVCAVASSAFGGEPWITLYNQDFAVVRITMPLDLAAGETRVTTSEMTAHLEPDSVILRDPTCVHEFRVLEQNYRNDPVSQERLLALFEGQTIEFLVPSPTGAGSFAQQGKVVRSGYVPHRAAFQRYGQNYWQTQMATAESTQPIIEVDGKLRFGLPGQPLFPSLADDSVLAPRLEWVLASAAKAAFEAELAYVTGGFTWSADYNVIAPESGDVADVVGWVTMDNQSGTTFHDARIKLMAGDVNKLEPQAEAMDYSYLRAAVAGRGADEPISEKAFDEFHLYTLARPTTLRDRETKQVEFVRAAGVKSARSYVYDGAAIDSNRYRGWDRVSIRTDADYGSQSNSKVFTVLEFANTEDDGLGIPLPKGRVRFYRRDDDGRLEFVGENQIDHTPKDEKIEVYTGNSFDLVGERTRTEFSVDSNRSMLDESFRIVLRNHKTEAVEIRVVERLYRWSNWKLTKQSDEFGKIDSRTIEFRVSVPAGGERVVEYTVHYWW